MWLETSEPEGVVRSEGGARARGQTVPVSWTIRRLCLSLSLVMGALSAGSRGKARFDGCFKRTSWLQ